MEGLIELARNGEWKVFRSDAAPRYGESEASHLLETGESIAWKVLEQIERDGDTPVHLAVEYSVPRNIRGVLLEINEDQEEDFMGSLHLEYWYDRWMGPKSGGWVPIDDPWNGEWRRGETVANVEDSKSYQLEFDRISPREGSFRSYYGQPPPTFFKEAVDYRRALKFRVVFDRQFRGKLTDFRLFGMSRPRNRKVEIAFFADESGERNNVVIHDLAVSCGRILEISPPGNASAGFPIEFRVSAEGPQAIALSLEVPSLEGLEDPGEEALLTLSSSRGTLTVRLEDIESQGVVDGRRYGVAFLSARPGTILQRLHGYRERYKGVKSTRRKITEHSEQNFWRMLSDLPGKRATIDHFKSQTWQAFGLYPTNQRMAVNELGELRIGCDFHQGFYRPIGESFQEGFFRWSGNFLFYRFGVGRPAAFWHWGSRSSIHRDGLPFLTNRWKDRIFSYRQEIFLSYGDPAVTSFDRLAVDHSVLGRVKMTVRNRGEEEANAQLHLQTSIDDKIEKLSTENDLILCDDQVRARWHSDDAWQIDEATVHFENEDGFASGPAISFRKTLDAGEEAVLEFSVPILSRNPAEFAELFREIESHRPAKRKMKKFWRDVLDRPQMRVHLPDAPLNRLWNANLIHVLSALRVQDGIWHVPAATFSYTECPNESYYVCRSLDFRGLLDWSFRCFEGLMRDQGKAVPPGAYGSAEGCLLANGIHVDDKGPLAYGLHHGAALATIAYHAKYRRDKDWIKRHSGSIASACGFITRERRPTQCLDGQGRKVPEYGLLVPGKQEDNALWAFWLGVNAWAYHGLYLAAEVLADIEDPRAADLKAEARNYKNDIIEALQRASECSPLVTFADGEAVPHIPSAVGRPGRGRGWINEVLYGPIHLHTCGLLPADDARMQDALDDFEDNLAMSEEWGLVIPPHESDWFSEGGRCPQHTLVQTFFCYLERDEIAAALRTFFNTLGSIFHENMAYTSEWSAFAGHVDGPPYKITDESVIIMWLRSMLVHEQNGGLRLLPATPREWLCQGEIISVERAHTLFGELSLAVESEIESNESIKGVLDLRKVYSPEFISLRLRHPEKIPLQSVTVNGDPFDRFDPDKEEIDLTGFEDEVSIVALYNV